MRDNFFPKNNNSRHINVRFFLLLQAVKGARFYGHMWWIGFGSYSSLIPGPTTIIKSISFVFKTNQLTGIIMYNNENVSQSLNNRVIMKLGWQCHPEVD